MARQTDGSAGNRLTNAHTLLYGDAWTVWFWLKLGSTAQTNRYILYDGNVDGNYQFAILFGFAAGKVEFYAAGNTGGNPRTGSQITIPDTDWHHIAYRKAAGSGAWDYFLDGVKTQISASITFACANRDRFSLFDAYDGGAPLNGALAEVFVFPEYALDDADIYTAAKGLAFNGGAYSWPLWGEGTVEPSYGAYNPGTYANLSITGTVAQAVHPPVIHPQSMMIPGRTAGLVASLRRPAPVWLY